MGANRIGMDHSITLRPCFIHGFVAHIGGRNRNDIKGYLAELFGETLRSEYAWHDAPEIIGGTD